MCNCPNSPWVQRARGFLVANQNSQNEQWRTIDFLIRNNHCGIDSRVDIESILQYLNSTGINLTREEFQQTVLGELKRDGIVATLVYPGPQGGVFIPCNEDEVKIVANQILDRVSSEVGNLEGVAQQTSFENLLSLLRHIISWIRGNL